MHVVIFLLLHHMEALFLFAYIYLIHKAYSGRLFSLVITFSVDYHFRLSHQSPIFHVQVYISVSITS